MKPLLDKVFQISRFINGIAGVGLLFLMLLTVADVTLRLFKRPILGTYELVSLSGALVFGLSLPFTSWMRKHIYVDFFIAGFSKKVRKVFNTATRCLVITLFFWIGFNLVQYGMDLKKSGEVSSTLHIPFYFIAYAVGICCFIQCLVLFCDILKIFRGEYE